MRTILLSILVLCLVSCEQAQNTAASTQVAATQQTELQNVYTQQGQILTVAKQPIKTAKKRNCSSKQTFEGARGGIYHIDTAKNGNVYKHYAK